MLTQIRRFMQKNEVDSLIGEPLFQIDERLLYYYGDGVIISYTSKCFKVVNGKRIKHGEEGMYALAVLHFSDVEMLKLYLRLDSFDEKNAITCNDFCIDGTITYDMTFQDIHELAVKKVFNGTYREGETRRIVDGKMKTVNLFIMHDNYTLFFRGKSEKSKVSGFKCVFEE